MSNYEIQRRYPRTDTVKRAYDDADYCRAVQAYKFFCPTVSFEGTRRGNLAQGAVPNKIFPLLEHALSARVTPNSDTPYSGLPLDLSQGPMVIELPPGPLMGAAKDLTQRWVMDLGPPGPDASNGGKHLLLPPGYSGSVPEGYHAAMATMNRVLVLLRAIPPHGNNDAANAPMKTAKVYPLTPRPDWKRRIGFGLSKATSRRSNGTSESSVRARSVIPCLRRFRSRCTWPWPREKGAGSNHPGP